MGLFPVFGLPSVYVAEEQGVEQYRRSPAFDVEAGEFVMDGGGRLEYGSGLEAWVLWCVKTIQTERWAHLAYRGNIGTELGAVFLLTDRSAQESAIERTVTEALLADPRGRTVRVYDFDFAWEADSVVLTCTVQGQQGDTAGLSVKL